MQVTNHRSNVRKPEVPLMTDSVSKLQIIGKETVAKLRDLRSALASAHHEDVQTLEDYIHETNSVRTGVCNLLHEGHMYRTLHACIVQNRLQGHRHRCMAYSLTHPQVQYR